MDGGALRLQLVHGCGGDFELLSPAQVRQACILLNRLREDHTLGKPLEPVAEHQRFAGSLVGWWSAKTDGVSYHETVAVVYRPVGETLEIVAVAPRLASEVYRRAMARLAPEEPRWRRFVLERKRAALRGGAAAVAPPSSALRPRRR